MWPARPYVPEASDPGPKADGMTRDWSEAMAEARRMHEERSARPEPPRRRHARGHVLLGAVARGIGAALIALGELVAAAGTAVRGMGIRDL